MLGKELIVNTNKKANSRVVSFIVLGMFILATVFSVGIASGVVAPVDPTAKHCTLLITNSADVATVEFPLGATVFISWSADGTVDIEVKNDATNEVVYSQYGAAMTGEDSFVPPSPGDYTVYVNGLNTKIINIDTFFVVPESVLGSLAALGAGVAAFGTVAVVKRKRA